MLSREESLRLQREGMAKAASKKQKLLVHVRYVAREIARSHGRVTMDDVSSWYAHNKLFDLTKHLGPAAGSVFRGDHWEFKGFFVSSEKPSNHGRLLKVWRLK